MDHIQFQLSTPVGKLFLVAAPQGLKGVYVKRQKIALVKRLTQLTPQEIILSKTVRQIEEYFAGKRKTFDLNLYPTGTLFQQQVWRQLVKIPFGTTVSYRDIAKRINNPKAVRAVGSANGKNPYCIIVPCHRVIAADGSIGGYAGGIAMKKQLLALEQQ